MDSEIIFHIGAAKTGSSAIQAFMRVNRAALRAAGLLVPDAELGPGERVSGEHVMTLQRMMDANDPTAIAARMDALVEAAGGGAVLISAENLSNLGKQRHFARTAERHRSRAILYIRRQDELIASAWQQWHSKVEDDFDAWLIRSLRQYGQWEQVISAWEEVVGAGRVAVRLFERDAMAGGSLTRDFLQALGLDPDDPAFEHEIGTVNPSYSDVITPLVAGNRAIFEDANDNGFYALVGRLTGDSYVERRKVSLMSRAQRDAIGAFYAQMNARVRDRFFPGRPHLFAPVDHGKYQYLTREEIVRRQLSFITEMIVALSKSQENGR